MFCFIRTTFRLVNDNNFLYSPKLLHPTIGSSIYLPPLHGDIFCSLISASLPINSWNLFFSCEFELLPDIFYTQGHSTSFNGIIESWLLKEPPSVWSIVYCRFPVLFRLQTPSILTDSHRPEIRILRKSLLLIRAICPA